MKILHVWDQAGVACVLAKHQRRLGHAVDVVKRTGFDNYGIMPFYNDMELNMDGGAFTDFVLYIAQHYDLIHIHSLREILELIMKKYPDKKCVMHFHGWELRHNSASTSADIHIVSTPDLLDYMKSATYLPNPVDIEHFNNAGYTPTRDTLYNVVTTYDKMPSILKQFRHYVDQKYENDTLLKAYSLLGLQALACGLTVLNYEDKHVNGLPEQHRPDKVVNLLEELYHHL